MKLALHIGFAGARSLWPKDWTDEKVQAAEQSACLQLRRLLGELPTRLHVADRCFRVGISQIAIGADSIFADACAAESIPLRVFLPQTRDVYLRAIGSTSRDFSKSQCKAAVARLDDSHVIEEAVVSVSSDRRTRFSECNVEIARASDVLVSLQKFERETGKKGGTDELVALAHKQGKPLLAIAVEIEDGEPKLHADWQRFEQFKAPALPKVLKSVTIRDDHWLDGLKNHGSTAAEAQRKQFERRTRVVVWAHVGATALAAAALAISYAKATGVASLAIAYPAVPILLSLEVLLLAWGWYTHRALHHDATTHGWADVRLIAEIARSAQAIVSKESSRAAQHTPLQHLLDLPLPESFKHLIQTINVLHLKQSRAHRQEDWQIARARYLAERIDKPEKGQLAYFTKQSAEAKKSVARAHRWFWIYTLAAILATATKLLLPQLGIKLDDAAAVLSWFAILLPVMAVAVMSISASLDKEARASTYQEMLDFLAIQKHQIENAASEPEFLRLQAETELRLLSEVVNWFHRRRFVNPA